MGFQVCDEVVGRPQICVSLNRFPFAGLFQKMMAILLSVTHVLSYGPACDPSCVSIYASCTRCKSLTRFYPAERRNRVEPSVLFTRRPSPSVSMMTCSHQKHVLARTQSARLDEANKYGLGPSWWLTKICHLVCKNRDDNWKSFCIIARWCFTTSLSTPRLRITCRLSHTKKTASHALSWRTHD